VAGRSTAPKLNSNIAEYLDFYRNIWNLYITAYFIYNFCARQNRTKIILSVCLIAKNQTIFCLHNLHILHGLTENFYRPGFLAEKRQPRDGERCCFTLKHLSRIFVSA